MAVTLTTEEVVAIAEEAKGYQERISELESENRHLQRALWLARAMLASCIKDEATNDVKVYSCLIKDTKSLTDIYDQCQRIEDKCLERMDKYKEVK